MPRNIGPDMLANLDAQLAAGTITAAEHEARKVEVLELIRKGQAVEYTTADRIVAIAFVIIAALVGLWMLATAGSNGALGGVVIGVAILAIAAAVAWKRLLPR